MQEYIQSCPTICEMDRLFRMKWGEMKQRRHQGNKFKTKAAEVFVKTQQEYLLRQFIWENMLGR